MSQYDINDPRNSNSPYNLLNIHSPFYNPERAVAQSGASILFNLIGVIFAVFFWLPVGILLMVFKLFVDDDATAFGWALAVYVGLVIRLLWWAFRENQKKAKTDDV